MKRKILLPLVLLAGLSLTGCKWSQKDQPSSKYKVEITNKTELQAEWFAGLGSSRGLSLTLTPEGNPVAEMVSGNLTVTSSNPEVANVTGLNINALAEGATTVTVKYHGAKDSVDLTILPEQTVPVKYGVTHYGTAEDPLTNEEALIVAKHPKYAEAQEDLYVGGTIASFYHAPGARTDGYVSWFLQPAQEGGEQFEVYKCKKADGSNLTDDDVWVNGYAIAHGRFTSYNGQYETSEAVFESCEGNKPEPRTTIQSTFAQALEVGAALADGADSYNYYQFDAYVTAKEGSNFFLTAAQGEELVSATSDAAHGERSYYSNAIEIYNPSGDALLAKLKKDAKVTVTMILKNYHGQVENLLALTADDVTVITEGGEWSYEQLTVTQALAKIAAIDISGVTKDKTTLYAENGKNYQVTGIVVKKGSTWDDSSTYKNADFYIADEAGDQTNALQVFRYADKTIFDALVVDQTQVKVTCQLAAYVRVNDGVPSIGAKETNQNPTTEILGQIVPELTGVEISPKTANADVAEGEVTQQFTASPVPSTAHFEGVTVNWSVDPGDQGVTVNENGLVTISETAVTDDQAKEFSVIATINIQGEEKTDSATLTVVNTSSGGEVPTVKISELANEDVVEGLKARVMAVGSDNKNFYIDDGSAGILAYASAATTGISAGDCVTVNGTVSTYNNTIQIGSATVAKSQDEAPEPTAVTALTSETAAAEFAATSVSIGGRYSFRTGVVTVSGSYATWTYGETPMENGAKVLAGMQSDKVYDVEGYLCGRYKTQYLLFVPTSAVEVEIPATGLELNKSEASVKQGATLQLTASPLPAGSSFSDAVEWTSDDVNEKITVDQTGLVTVEEDAEVGATATITATYGEATATCLITVEEAGTVVELTATMQYSGSSTTNMTDGNNAATVGLDADVFTVTADKGGSSSMPGLNKDGSIRLYNLKNSDNGNVITISLGSGTIKSITITLASTTTATLADTLVTDGSNTLSGTDGAYTVNAAQVVIKNAINSANSAQLHISSIVIVYEA